MNILLINPPVYRLEGRHYEGIPLGLCYIASFLQGRGKHNVTVYDADYPFSSEKITESFLKRMEGHYEYKKALREKDHPIWNEIRQEITKFAPDVVGITSMTSTYTSALIVAEIVKEIHPQVIIVFGGAHPTVAPQKVLDNKHVDIVVRGEGEITFNELVDAIESQSSLNDVLGISYKESSKTVNNPQRPLIQNLDEISHPALDLLHRKNEYSPNTFGHVMTSRGCPFNCIFCASDKIWGRKVRFRSPENVITELERLVVEYGTKQVRFWDDTFTLNKKRTEQICDLMVKEELELRWECVTRVDTLTYDLLKKMKRVGCFQVNIGIESGNKETLKKIRKGFTLEQVEKACKWAKKLHILVNTYFMFGFPWESEREIMDTIKFMKHIDPDIATLFKVIPYPGTELFQMVKASGVLTDDIDWSDYDRHSPKVQLTNKLSEEEFSSLMGKAIETFDKHNSRKSKQKYLRKLMNSSYIFSVLLKKLKFLLG